MKTIEDIRLYCFTANNLLGKRDPLKLVEAQIMGGADLIQLREKDMSKKKKLELGFKLRSLTRKHGVFFIVNDDIDLALILDADGVHLGQDDIPIQYARSMMKNKIIGISTHSFGQVREAVDSGADYIGVGPVFQTKTKTDIMPLVGLDLISQIGSICTIPFIAIGGIKKDNLDDLRKVGCSRVAIISDILLAPDIEKQCQTIKRMLI